MREERTEVLVVGAGPVGLTTALALASRGLQTLIVDREARTTSRSYACALHPASLQVFDELGLTNALLGVGRKIQRMAFFEGAEQRAELDLSKLESKFPYLLVLPQSELEKILADHLRDQFDVHVHWNHRLSGLEQGVDCAVATIDQLTWSSTGYIVPHSDLTVRRQMPLRAQLVVGADGHHSTVRQRCGIDFEKFGEPLHFAAYEFIPEGGAGPEELRVVMDAQTTNVLWPLPGGKLRWTFQLTHGYDFPEKERRAARLSNNIVDEEIRQYVEKTALQRAPWYKDGVKEITWCTRVSFEKRLARSFGQGQCWLAGDAAHQTGPAGAQSMNSGILEASTLAPAAEALVNGTGSRSSLEEFNSQYLSRWRMLLGLSDLLRVSGETSAWTTANVPRLLSCIPAVDNDLMSLAKQLRLSSLA